MKLCDYGCGKEAFYQLKNGKFCCSKSSNSCDTIRQIRSKESKGRKSWNTGLTKETSKSLKTSSEKRKGMILYIPRSLDPFENIDHILCSYGCNKEAKYILKNGKVCCNDFISKCSGMKKKNSSGNRGRIISKETRLKLSLRPKRIKSEEERDKIKKSRLGRDFRSKESIEKQRQYMLNGGSIKCIKAIKKISNEEIKIRDIVKELYPEADPQHKVFNYALDIALVDKKIAIEYDGYYHFNCQESIDYHIMRQKKIEGEGWKFIRYTIFDKFPTLDQVKKDIDSIL